MPTVGNPGVVLPLQCGTYLQAHSHHRDGNTSYYSLGREHGLAAVDALNLRLGLVWIFAWLFSIVLGLYHLGWEIRGLDCYYRVSVFIAKLQGG